MLAIQWVASGGFGVMQWMTVERLWALIGKDSCQRILDALKAILCFEAAPYKMEFT